ncbi:sigma-w pathway protein YsdB [Paraliobacillus quinghaiensis]|uniref:Sigma-w pathway protein YsdB n=1 Tax=Paraliobacillus quinghaiensis TaxID=470815 RepID=A0A917WTA1_9BACI|nr:sigma-w pathway protein ysdB [Paraliobacillus quinghaiensis]GGM26831.1 sigma-w pathway protein YsdB [Paraliobacillus quinghaiensis]
MIVVFIFRFLIFIAIIFMLYSAYKYIINPKRKLEVAKDKKVFYFLDESDNIKKNFLMTYKGILFEGEKYLGTTENSFDVINISVSARHPSELKGLERDDLYFLEEEILIRYPYATVEWKNPINKLVLKK